jgi:hypothetical protein
VGVGTSEDKRRAVMTLLTDGRRLRSVTFTERWGQYW